MKIRETIQSKALTRDSRSGGISRWRSVSQTAFPKAMPPTKRPFATEIASAGSGGKSASEGSEESDHATRQNGTGCLGRRRKAMRPPITPPIAPPVRISP
jgi:hypothetical protein